MFRGEHVTLCSATYILQLIQQNTSKPFIPLYECLVVGWLPVSYR